MKKSPQYVSPGQTTQEQDVSCTQCLLAGAAAERPEESRVDYHDDTFGGHVHAQSYVQENLRARALVARMLQMRDLVFTRII